MAVTATFRADFTSFMDAVKGAELKLKDMESGASKVTSSLGRMAEGFSGKKIIGDANLIARAIGDIENVSKLTEAEQARVNRTVTEALAKYKALGQSAPSDLHALADATKKVVIETEKVATKAPGFFGDLTSSVKATALGMISAQAVIGGVSTAFHTLTAFVSSSVDSYSKAEAAQKKLTAALTAQGMATPTVVQQYDELASTFQRTTAYSDDLINEMEGLLVQVGNVMPSQMKGALTAATDLASGLGIDLRTATMLVGKAFEGETGTLKKYGIVIDEATLKAKGMPAVLDAIQSKFGGQASAEVETYAGKIKQLENNWDNFKEAVGKAIVLDPTVIALLNFISGQASAAGGASGGLSKLVDITLGSGARDALFFADTYVQQLNRVQAATKELEDRAFRDLPKVAADAWKQMIPTTAAQQIAVIAAAYKPLTEEQKKAADAARQHAEAIKRLNDAYSGADLARRVSDIGEAMRGIKSSDGLKRIAEDVGKLSEEGAKLTPEMVRLGIAFGTIGPKIVPINQLLEDMRGQIQIVTPTIGDMWTELNKPIPYGITHLKDEFAALVVVVPKASDQVKKFSSTLSDDLAASIGNISNTLVSAFTGGGGLSGAISGVGSQLGATLGKSIGKGITALGKFGGPIGEAIGALAGPLMEKIFSMFGTAGRDAVKDFASQQGGFDSLHVKLAELGDEGERLWIKLTQGTGRNNPKQAQATIDEITAAWERNRAKAVAAGEAVEEQAGKQSEATTKALAAIQGMTDQIDALNKSIENEAPEEVMGVIEQQTRAQIDAITKQRDVAQLMLAETAGDAADAAEQAAQAIEQTLKAHDFVVKLRFDTSGMPTGATGGGSNLPGFATGTNGYQNFGTGTPVMLHGWEKVTPKGKVEGANTGDTIITLVMPDGDVLLRQFVKSKKRLGIA